MKNLLIFIYFFSLSSCMNSNQDPQIITIKNNEIVEDKNIKSDIVFGVRGNCGMCKSTIEKAALSINDVKSASWDSNTKLLSINVNNLNLFDLKSLHIAIANSGYDTNLESADSDTYNKLPMCCQYDRQMELTK